MMTRTITKRVFSPDPWMAGMTGLERDASLAGYSGSVIDEGYHGKGSCTKAGSAVEGSKVKDPSLMSPFLHASGPVWQKARNVARPSLSGEGLGRTAERVRCQAATYIRAGSLWFAL